MKMNKYILAATLSGLLATPAFAQGDEDVRNASGFSRIEMDDMIDVDISFGSDFSVKVLVDKEYQQYINTDVSGQTLHIDIDREYRRLFRRNSWNFSRRDRRRDDDRRSVYDGELRVVVVMPSIERLENFSSGNAIIVGLNEDMFHSEINSSGDLTISGTCKNGSFETNSSGNIDGRDLTCENLDLEINSSGDQIMNVTGEVTGQISSSGSMNLSGTCSHGDFSIDSSGDLNARNLICKTASMSVDSSGDTELTVTDKIDLDLDSSGDVDIYGDPKIGRLHKSGSGDLESHDK
jgi:hypothetical protein